MPWLLAPLEAHERHTQGTTQASPSHQPCTASPRLNDGVLSLKGLHPPPPSVAQAVEAVRTVFTVKDGDFLETATLFGHGLSAHPVSGVMLHSGIGAKGVGGGLKGGRWPWVNLEPGQSGQGEL